MGSEMDFLVEGLSHVLRYCWLFAYCWWHINSSSGLAWVRFLVVINRTSSFILDHIQVDQIPAAFPASNQCILNIEENICNLRKYLTRLADFLICFARMFFKTIMKLLNERDENASFSFKQKFKLVHYML